MDITVFQTPGNGYIEDLQYYISECFPDNSNMIILTITADLPLITSEIINQVLIEYKKSRKPAMCIAVPVELLGKWFEAQYRAWRCGSLGIKYIKK